MGGTARDLSRVEPSLPQGTREGYPYYGRSEPTDVMKWPLYLICAILLPWKIYGHRGAWLLSRRKHHHHRGAFSVPNQLHSAMKSIIYSIAVSVVT